MVGDGGEPHAGHVWGVGEYGDGVEAKPRGVEREQHDGESLVEPHAELGERVELDLHVGPDCCGGSGDLELRSGRERPCAVDQ